MITLAKSMTIGTEEDVLLKEQYANGLEDSVCDWIINKYSKKIIQRILLKEYCYFSRAQQQKICESAVEAAHKTIKREDIKQHLSDYFETSNQLFLEGFVRFRLKEYRDKIEEIVETCVEDFVVEKEYSEFLNLLKYFVNVQEAKIDELTVVAEDGGRYVYYDSHSNEISEWCTRDFMEEFTGGEINYDDLLISVLIVLAPNKVFLHNSDNIKNRELINTIENVFEERLELVAKM